jgi:hypothetical protein
MGGPVPLMFIGLSSGGVSGPNLEEVGMVGLALAMPASTVSAWLVGELVSGPTRWNHHQIQESLQASW